MDGTVIEEKASPYERIGGAEGVRRLVDAFYDTMERNPAYAELRAMHEPDLGPTRDSLTGFLSVWLGGPRKWIEKRGGFCIMSRHAKMNVTGATAGSGWPRCAMPLRKLASSLNLLKKWTAR